MAFISGPRQVGKTTFAKSLAGEFDQFHYKNWDESMFRRLWTKSPNDLALEFDLASSGKSRLLALDEIHKSKGWKSRLKGLYDEYGETISVTVTGSARLNVYKKGGDSLMGRYLNFRLHPLSYGEAMGQKILPPDEWRRRLVSGQSSELKSAPKTIEKLLRLSGFP